MPDPKTMLGTSTALIEESLRPLIEDAEKRGYAAGWKAAMNTISSATTSASVVVPGIGHYPSTPNFLTGAGAGGAVTIGALVYGTSSLSGAAVNTITGVPPVGGVTAFGDGDTYWVDVVAQKVRTAAEYVAEVIRQEPGCSGIRIVEALANRGTPIKERTVRTALHRLKTAGVVVNSEGQWYFVNSTPEALSSAANDVSEPLGLSDEEMRERGIIPPQAATWGLPDK